MNRQTFGSWGRDLSPEEFAGALAAHLNFFYENTPPDILKKLAATPAFTHPTQHLTDGSPIPLCLDTSYHPTDDADGRFVDLHSLEGWKQIVESLYKEHETKHEEFVKNRNTYVDHRPFGLRFELFTNPENAVFLSNTLADANTDISGVDAGPARTSVYLRVDEPSTEVGWNWPLKVGFLDDANSLELKRNLEEYAESEKYWLQPLVSFVQLNSESDRCDLLLIPHSLQKALELARKTGITLSADCILVTGTTTEKPVDIPVFADALRRIISTSGIGLVDVYDDKLTHWFTELLRELSHNHPIDVALFQASRATNLPKPFLIASRQLVEFSKLSESIKILGEKLRNSGLESGFEINWSDGRSFGIEEGQYDAERLGAILAEKSDSFIFDFESSSATATSKIDDAFKKNLAVEQPAKNSVRWIQAQVFEVGRDGLKRADRTIRSGIRYETAIRIGMEDKGWLQNTAEFPDEVLPKDRSSVDLTVVFTEPSLFIEPQVSTVVLPPEGNSSICTFPFYVREDIREIEARISILYRNRILQTALLRANVASRNSESDNDHAITLSPEVMVRADFSGLKDRRDFDAAFILNEDPSGEPKLTAIKNSFVSFTTPVGLEAFNKQVDTFLTWIADDHENYSGLDSPGTVQLLWDLAKQGRSLYRSLQENSQESQLAAIIFSLSQGEHSSANPKRIQVISARPDTRLPFEFLYDRAAPVGGDAKLCPNAKAALEQGSCSSDCPGLKEPEGRVCPLGFWGLSHIIERHTHRRANFPTQDRGDFRFQAEPVENRRHLGNVFKKVLFAASNKADVTLIDEVTNTPIKGIAKMNATLKTITGQPPSWTRTWPEWHKQIKSDPSPSMLLMLTHTVPVSGGIPALEIEDGKNKANMLLESTALESLEQYLKRADPPIVLLIGCSTGNARIEFNNFIASFRQIGAAIIVSTGAAILGRHAVPVTEELLKTLSELSNQPNVSFGEVMRLVKQRMLSRGFPMVLTLMSYGDADWQIGSSK